MAPFLHKYSHKLSLVSPIVKFVISITGLFFGLLLFPVHGWSGTNGMVASCNDLENEIKKIEISCRGTPPRVVIGSSSVSEASDLLKTREFPEEDAVRLAALALHESFSSVFAHYVPLVELDCPRQRLRLGRALIQTFASFNLSDSSSDANFEPLKLKSERSKIFRGIQKLLTEYKYPTPVEALSDALLLESALKTGLFQPDAAQSKEMNALIEDLLRSSSALLFHSSISAKPRIEGSKEPRLKESNGRIAVMNKSLGAPLLPIDAVKNSAPLLAIDSREIGEDSFERLAKILAASSTKRSKSEVSANLQLKTEAERSEAFLKSDPEVQKIKPSFINEVEASAKFLAHERAVVAKLKTSF